eukprot:2000-Heterococcus_DN1.PRE.1
MMYLYVLCTLLVAALTSSPSSAQLVSLLPALVPPVARNVVLLSLALLVASQNCRLLTGFSTFTNCEVVPAPPVLTMVMCMSLPPQMKLLVAGCTASASMSLLTLIAAPAPAPPLFTAACSRV